MFEILATALEKLGFTENPRARALRIAGNMRVAQHEAGWVVFKGGRPVATLSFIKLDWPWYHFRLSLIGDDHGQKQLFEGSVFREPYPDLIFQSRADSRISVADGPFLANLWSSDVVGLRDFRPFE